MLDYAATGETSRGVLQRLLLCLEGIDAIVTFDRRDIMRNVKRVYVSLRIHHGNRNVALGVVLQVKLDVFHLCHLEENAGVTAVVASAEALACEIGPSAESLRIAQERNRGGRSGRHL